MRWLHEAWHSSNQLLAEGIDLRGLTVWSLLGAYDWDNLLCQDGASYESGVFDVRSGQPRPTALYHMIKGLIEYGKYKHPALAGPGWWQRDIRYCWPAEAA